MIQTQNIQEGIAVFENVCTELRKYLETKPVFPVLLGFGHIILYVTVGFFFINAFTYLGNLVVSLLFYAFMVSVVLCVANKNFQALMIGFGVRVIICLINLFQGFFFEYGFLMDWSALFGILVYGFFAYEAYKKTLKKA